MKNKIKYNLQELRLLSKEDYIKWFLKINKEANNEVSVEDAEFSYWELHEFFN